MATHTPQRTDSDADSKHEIAHVEEKEVVDVERTEAPHVDIDDGFDPAFVKRTMRKVDWRLIPVLSAMYCVSLIDRTNLSGARQANDRHFDKELGTTIGDRYSIITIMFFIPYIILEIPSQVGLRAFGARIWLSSAVLAWGAVMVGMGYVTNWQQLAGLRALLGVFESALFPGAAYILSCWYPRRSMATRNVIFYTVAAVVGSFSSPLGYTFTLMHGRLGHSGWRWMFTMYGIITLVVAIFGYLFIQDIPSKATFLTEEERHFIMTRIERDRADSKPDPMTLRQIVQYAADWKIWLFGLFFMSTTVASYSLAYFLPVILQSMGFNNIETMVLNAPAHGYGIFPALITAYIADKWRHCRAWTIVFNAVCLIVGTCMYSQLPLSQKAARYAGIFLAVGGANANVPLVMSWAQTSVRGQGKRAVSAAIIVAWGGVGGILAGVVFMQKEALKYPTGVFFTIGVNAFTAVASVALSFWFRYQNSRANRGAVILEGDPTFRYQG